MKKRRNLIIPGDDNIKPIIHFIKSDIEMIREKAFKVIKTSIEAQGYDFYVDLDTNIKTYVDSLDRLEICVAVEKAFDIEIKDEKIGQWLVVNDVIDDVVEQITK